MGCNLLSDFEDYAQLRGATGAGGSEDASARVHQYSGRGGAVGIVGEVVDDGFGPGCGAARSKFEDCTPRISASGLGCGVEVSVAIKDDGADGFPAIFFLEFAQNN